MLRLLHLDLLRSAKPHLLSTWQRTQDWLPHLKHDVRVFKLAEYLPSEWTRGTICDPQIVLHFPHPAGHAADEEIRFHRDVEPPWADGRRYASIVGVALSSWRKDTGTLLVPGGAVLLERGDAVCMHPSQEHSPGVNVSGEVRYGVYFRWLA